MSDEDQSVCSLLPRPTRGSLGRMLKSCRKQRLGRQDTGRDPSLQDDGGSILPLALTYLLQLDTPTSEMAGKISRDAPCKSIEQGTWTLETESTIWFTFLFPSPAEAGGQLSLLGSSSPCGAPIHSGHFNPWLLQGCCDAVDIRMDLSIFISHCLLYGVIFTADLWPLRPSHHPFQFHHKRLTPSVSDAASYSPSFHWKFSLSLHLISLNSCK